MTEFSAYHTIRSIILEYVEPYIIKLIDPKHPNASVDGHELWQAVDDNNLECVKIYRVVRNIVNADFVISTAIERNYADIINYLLPYIVDHYEIMCHAIKAENTELMKRIYPLRSWMYWNGHLNWGDHMRFANRNLELTAVTPTNKLLNKWFVL